MNCTKRLALVLGIAIIMAAPAVRAAQDVVNTRHNLSTVPPVGVTRDPAFVSTAVDQVCVYCHTPHNALPDAQLWNHEATTASYTLYGSSTLKTTTVVQPTGKSRLCLSCHDGTVALGAVQNPQTGVSDNLASVLLTGRANLATDLSNDHPISFAYDTALLSANPELADPATTGLPLEGTQLQCTTCHDPHEKDTKPFLRLTTLDGTLCTTCHQRADAWPTSTHATSTAAVAAGDLPWRRAEWVASTVAGNACLSCHTPHNANFSPERLIAQSPTQLNGIPCLDCHDGSPASNIAADVVKTATHPVGDPTYAGVHDDAKVEDPLTMPLHAECMDCHNPHTVASAPPMLSFDPNNGAATLTTPPLANARIQDATGLDVNGNPLTSVTNQYELCFKCHGRPGQNTCGTQRCGSANTRGMIRVDMVTSDPVLGGSAVIVDRNIRDRVYSGATGLVSWHPIEANNSANDGMVPSIDLSTLGTGLNSSTSLIYCTDCHNSETSDAATGPSAATGPNGPHGSTWEGLLTAQYTFLTDPPNNMALYSLCFKCHDQGNLITDVTNFPHSAHIQARGAACIDCHDPHGSHKMGRLINFLWVSDGIEVVDCIRGKGGGTQPCTAAVPEPRWEDLSAGLPYAGQCFLQCHNATHNPKTY